MANSLNKITTKSILDATIANADIADDAVTSSKLADNAVVTVAINADAVTSSKLADNAVVTAAINADAVTGAKIADDAIDSEHYADGSIDTAHIADDAVTADKLANAINTDIAAKAVLTGSTDNTICTVTGANAIAGEANLTFDGSGSTSSLTINNSTSSGDAFLYVKSGEGGGAVVELWGDEGDDNDDKWRIQNAGDARLGFRSKKSGSWVEKLGITDYGDLHPTGHIYMDSGYGIAFDPYGGSGANLLHDYEEGTWTPTLNANLTINSSYNTWSYTKIGRQVTIRGLFICSSVSGTNDITIGLPFASANMTQLAGAGGICNMFRRVNHTAAGLASFVADDSSELRFYGLGEGTDDWTRITNDDIDTATEVYVTHTYFTA